MGNRRDQLRQSDQIRSELPENGVVGIGLICAEVTGADRGSETTPQGGMLVVNFLRNRADTLAGHPASAFRASRRGARTSAKS